MDSGSPSHRDLSWNNVLLLSYTLVDEVHSLVDEPVPRSRLDARVFKAAVVGLIFFGTLISTLGKLAYEIQAVGRDGALRPFQKPLLLVLLMFVGMSLNLPLSLFLDIVRRHRRSKGIPRRAAPMYVPLLQYDDNDEEIFSAPLLLDPASAGASSALGMRRRLIHKQLLLLLVPTLFDLLGSVMLNVGLLAVTASAAAMLRQSLLLFAALLGLGLWGKRLNKFHAAGLTGCTAGLMMVAAASLASGFGGSTAPHSRGVMAAGIGLVLASQLAAAAQLLFDHVWPSGRLQLSPLKVVGCEGMLGCALMLLLILPLADVSSIGADGWGLSEDCWDSLVMIASRPLLQLLLLVYTASLQAYNLCGMVTAGELSAVDTNLLQAVRTLFVWIINLLIYAAATAAADQAGDLLQPGRAVAAAAAAGTAAGGEQLLRSEVPVPVRALLQLAGQQQQWQQHQWQLQQPASLSSAGAAAAHAQQAAGLPQLASAAAGAGPSLWHELLQAGARASAGASVQPVADTDATLDLPGEPWLRWSFLQAAGFMVLVLAAVTYSKGDSEGLRRQLQDEAALIMLDQPPGSVAGSLVSGAAVRQPGRPFTSHMDIDTAAFLHSFSRRREPLYGVTPVSHSFIFGGSSSGRQRSLLQDSGGSGSLGDSLLGPGGPSFEEVGELAAEAAAAAVVGAAATAPAACDEAADAAAAAAAEAGGETLA